MASKQDKQGRRGQAGQGETKQGETKQGETKQGATQRQAGGSQWFGNLMIGAAVVLALAAAARWYVGDGRNKMAGAPDQGAVVDKGDVSPPATGGVAPQGGSSTRSLVSLPDSRKSDWQQWDDPSSDGWATELFHQHAKQQLKKLGEIITHAGQGIDPQKLAALVTEDFSCDALVPTTLQTVVDDGEFTVQRLATRGEENPAANSDRRAYVAAKGFSAALADLVSVMDGAAAGEPAINVQFKVVRVSPAGQEVITRQLVEISGPRAAGSVEQHATWQIRWSTVDEKHPKIASISVEDFEQTTLTSAGGRMFADCTESVLAENDCYQQQLLYGLAHWLQRSQDDRYIAILGTPGIAVGDVNNDGLDDLYLCQETGLPNRLFLQNRNGTLRDVSAEWGVDWLEWSRSALLVDLDNDGDRDLAVAVLGGIVLAENVAGGGFRFRTVVPTPDDIMSLSAVDYDQDGRLDLHTCIYYPNADINETSSSVMATESDNFVFHDANTGGRNTLLKNGIVAGGPWQFEDVTEAVVSRFFDTHGITNRCRVKEVVFVTRSVATPNPGTQSADMTYLDRRFLSLDGSLSISVLVDCILAHFTG